MLKVFRKRPTECVADLRADRGATDPILVIAAIAVSLVLLVGGSFAVSGIITNGHNLNAKSDLDKVAVAETAMYAQGDIYVDYKQTGTTPAETALETSGVGFNPTEGGKIAVTKTGNGWGAISKSAATATGPYYVRTSASNKVAEWNNATKTWVVAADGVKISAAFKEANPALSTPAAVTAFVTALAVKAG